MSLDWKRTWLNIGEEINCGRRGIMNIEVTESYLHVEKMASQQPKISKQFH